MVNPRKDKIFDQDAGFRGLYYISKLLLITPNHRDPPGQP